MLQVVELNSQLFQFASSALARDFDLTVVAFAGSNSFTFPARPRTGEYHEYRPRGMGSRHEMYVQEVRTTVRAMVASHDIFFQTVLCAVTLDLGDKTPALSMLNQGNSTSPALRLIAEYLGIPTGKRLHFLRQAVPNLAQARVY